MNHDHDFFQVSKLSEDQKKGLHQKWNSFFSPNSMGDLRSDAHQSQFIARNPEVDHTQIIGVDTVKLLGKVYPSTSLHSRVLAPLSLKPVSQTLRGQS